MKLSIRSFMSTNQKLNLPIHVGTRVSRKQWLHFTLIGICLILLLHAFLTYSWKTTVLGTLLASKDYTLSEHTPNDHFNFMVIRKEKKNAFTNVNDVNLRALLNVADSEGEKFPIDVHVIEAYDYQKLENDKAEKEEFRKGAHFKEALETDAKFMAESKKFFQLMLDLIQRCVPNIPSINDDAHYPSKFPHNTKYLERLGRIPVYGGHWREDYAEEPVRTEEMLNSFLKLAPQESEALEFSHKCYMDQRLKNYPSALYEQSKFNDFMKGDGIIYLGGTGYFELILLSVKALRDAGSRLPVEVIIPSRYEYNRNFCEQIFPTFNVRCKVMNDYVPDAYITNIKGYQLKNTAMLVSSFQRILYLDSDNIPLVNVDDFFVNAPFTNSHLVLWPDLWRRSTSPQYYKICEIEVNTLKKIRNTYHKDDDRGKENSFHDYQGTIAEASSETGQLLIDKKVHIETLILSFYYNYFGPDYYYALLSQGAAGEGDKETFIAAAHKLNLPYYQVKEFSREFGPPQRISNSREIFGMGQYDPIVDFIQATNGTSQAENIKEMNEPNIYEPEVKYIKNKAYDISKDNYDLHKFRSSKLAFLHANWPKLKTVNLFVLNGNGRGPLEGEGRRRRLYNTDLLKEYPSEDMELKIMDNLKWLHCTLGITLELYTDNLKEVICKQIDEQIEFLQSDRLKY